MSDPVTTLTIDARGAEVGSATYVRAMGAAQAAVDRLADAEERAAVAQARQTVVMTGMAGSIGRTASQWERLRASVDPAIAATKAIEQAQIKADAAFRRGIATQEEAARVVDLVRQRHSATLGAVNDNTVAVGRFTQATGIAGHQVTNLGYQLNDVAVSLASGQSPFTVLVQQGAQVLPILSEARGGIGGALRGIGTYLIGLVTPATAAAAALLAVGTISVVGLIRYNSEAEEMRRSLLGLGASTGTTVDGLARIAAQATQTGKVTESTAREMTAALAGTGKIGVENFEAIIVKTKDFAAVMSLDVTEATSRLAQAFADPVKGADELNQKLGFLSDRTRQNIVDLANVNDQFGAQRALVEALGPAISDAANRTTALGQAWNFVAGAASAAATAIAKAINGSNTSELLEAARKTVEYAKAQREKLGPLGFLAVTDAEVKRYEDVVTDLQERVRRQGQLASQETAAAASRQASITAGAIARSLDPVAAKFEELKTKRDQLGAALRNPADLANVEQVRSAYDSYGRAVESLTDANGKLISSQELLRQKDALAVDAAKAKTDAEKIAIAEKQKVLDLVGEVITKEEALRRVSQAGAMARIDAEKDAGKAASDSASAYDNLVQRTRDRIEELELEAQYASKTAAEVIKLKLAHDLERAAKRDGTEVTDEMRRSWSDLGDSLAAATKKLEQARVAQDALRDSARETGRQFSDLVEGLLSGSEGLKSALDSIGKSYFKNSLDALISGTGPLAAGLGTAPTEKGGLGGLFAPDFLKKMEKAVSTGTSGGFLSLFGAPQQGPTQSGATLDSAAGPNIAGLAGAGMAVIGAYGAGQQAQSPIVGGVTGALSGAVAGSMILPGIGTAIGAVIGGASGVLGGVMGQQAASKDRRKQMMEIHQQLADDWKAMQPDVTRQRALWRGEAEGSLTASSRDARQNFADAAKAGQLAGDSSAVFAMERDLQAFLDRSAGEFLRGFGGVLDGLQKGVGLDSPFAQALNNIRGIGEQLKGFVADTALVDGAYGAAQQASRDYALSLLTGAKQVSAVEAEMMRIQGTANGLQQVLVDLGMSADQAAAAISTGATVALANLKASFETDLTRKTLEAQDRGYINETGDLFAEIERLRADAALLGTDQARVSEYFQAAAQKIVDGADVSGAAFDDLIARFPALSGLVIEAGQAVDTAAQEIEAANRRLGYQDRLFAALNDSSSLDGALAAFDRQAERQRVEEIRAGGLAINDLEAALAAERFNIIQDFADRAVDEQKRALEEAQNFFDTFSRNLRQFVDGMRAGDDSPLSPQARLAAAQAQYNAQLALAQGGDRDAINGLTSYASSLLDAAKGFYASSPAFQAIFEQVANQLTALPTQVSAEQFIVDAIEDSSASLLSSIDRLDLNGDGMISLQEAANTNLAAIFSELDTNGDGQISRLELIKAAAQGTDANTEVANTLLAQVQSLGSATNSLMNSTNSLMASSNSMQQSAINFASTQNGLLNELIALNTTSVATLNALNRQFSLDASLTIRGAAVNNNMVTALNKIAYNTAFIMQYTGSAGGFGTNNIGAFASGGWINGPGTGTSDSVPIRASNGEFMVNARAAARHGSLLEAINGGGSLVPAIAMAAPANSNGNAEIVAELRRLYSRIERLEERLIQAEYGAAGLVREGVDQVRSEQRRGNADARMNRNDPRKAA